MSHTWPYMDNTEFWKNKNVTAFSCFCFRSDYLLLYFIIITFSEESAGVNSAADFGCVFVTYEQHFICCM
jgi:hypothetical protein